MSTQIKQTPTRTKNHRLKTITVVVVIFLLAALEPIVNWITDLLF